VEEIADIGKSTKRRQYGILNQESDGLRLSLDFAVDLLGGFN
jgi:hypothetical protein